jgi:predicted YcjX-like family ATPase
MLVENDFVRTELKLEEDPRLLAALAAIIDHAACRVGMSGARRDALTRAAEQTCRDTWPATNGRDPMVRIICDEMSDRIELTIQFPGTPESGTEAKLKELRKRVDKASTETRQGSFLITLVEYISTRQ